MQKVEIKSYDIEMEEWQYIDNIVKQFFLSAILHGCFVQRLDYQNHVFRNKVEEEINKIKSIEDKVNKLISIRSKGFIQNKLLLENVVQEIKNIRFLPIGFSRPDYVNQDAYIAFRETLNGICDYFSRPVSRKEQIIEPFKKWTVEWVKIKDGEKIAMLYKFMPMQMIMKFGYSIDGRLYKDR